jgi:hypothetical protein
VKRLGDETRSKREYVFDKREYVLWERDSLLVNPRPGFFKIGNVL